MNKKILVASILSLVLLSSSLVFAEGSVGAGAASEDDNYTVEEMLQYALEDERLAQAEYAAIMEAFDVTRPFSNIEKAEITHEAAVIGLYEARDLQVPDFDASAYTVLPDTLEEIYQIGIEAEINNIAMYEKFLEQDLDDDIRLVFEALRDGSIKHLQAFENAASRTGNASGYGRQSSGRGRRNF